MKKPDKKLTQLYEAADFIDSLLLYLEAGNNLYFSFKETTKYTQNNFLKEKCLLVLFNYSLGHSFINSLKNNLSENKNEHEIYNEIAESLILSLKLGTPLIKNLSTLSVQVKLRANSELEELAAKAPIKMIFPLVFFIFPVIFILLGAGSIKNLMQSLGF